MIILIIKKNENEIEDLKITDPEVKYLADQFLAYNFYASAISRGI